VASEGVSFPKWDLIDLAVKRRDANMSSAGI
jgi:hypothetical protein